MGFVPRTSDEFRRTFVAGVQGFVIGGGVVGLIGGAGLILAVAGVIDARWEQAALFLIGAVCVAIGVVVAGMNARTDVRR